MKYDVSEDPLERLTPEELDMVKVCLGEPSAERMERAIESIEQQVALEDLVVMIISTVGQAARCFLDFLTELNAGAPDAGDESTPEWEES